ncbi:hypothetical protein QQS21_000491 [Conoideocrella luteorostrata]|uniref:Uncharacterized protein n=1 Tax=Conoideocrella luteorostrata TaxID=1105319 RepID=A0AAJ0CZ71_9HYPO|nr:hypothetical protein QQS21_000491 [Conoideocrella luteorostrata]
MGICVNAATAYLISSVKVRTLTVVSGLVTNYDHAVADGHCEHRRELLVRSTLGWALFLLPVNPDGTLRFIHIHRIAHLLHPSSFARALTCFEVLFTVSNPVISDAFSPEMQSLAGGVFSVASQFGNSVGLAVTAAIAASNIERAASKDRRLALMEGFRAAFWTSFARAAAVVVISFVGFRKGGPVGKNND